MNTTKTPVPWVVSAVLALALALRAEAQSPPGNIAGGGPPSKREGITNAVERTFECTHVWFETNEVDDIAVRVDGVLVATLKQLRELGGPLLTNCVSLRVTNSTDEILVWGSCRNVCLGGWGFDGWNAQIPQGNQITLRPDLRQGVVDVAAGAGNTKPIAMTFIDGASVKLQPGTGGRLDVMKDGSYVFSARGSVAARNSDGQESFLTDNTLPLTGGPLVEVKDAAGNVQKVRLSPTVGVTITGNPGGEFVVKAGGQEVRVGVGQSKSVTLPNGAGMVLTQDPSGDALLFSVAKGDFRIAVDGMDGVRAVGLTGDNGVLRWNSGEHWVDVGNGGASRPIVVGLPGGASAGISAQGGVRFSGLGNDRFDVRSRGAVLNVEASGQAAWIAQVPPDNAASFMMNEASRFADVAASKGNKQPVVLSFVDGARVDLTAGTGGRVDVMRDRSFVFTARGEVNGRNGEGKEVVMTQNSLPLTGGPIAEVRDANGNVSQMRLSPTVKVALDGVIGEQVIAVVGDQEIRVGPAQSRTVALPNGTELVLTQDPGSNSLLFSVNKGDFRLTSRTLDGVEAVALTGQNGVLTWDKNERWLEVANRSPGSPVVVGLPGGASAGIPAQGGGRFSVRTETSFEAQARRGGLTVVAEGMTAWSAEVPAENAAGFMMRPSNRLVDVSAPLSNTQPVLLHFVDGARVDLRAGVGGRVDILADRTYVFTSNSRVTARDGGGKDLVLTENSLPLTGGPVVTTIDANGDSRTTRLSPTEHVVVAGDIGGEVTIRVGNRTLVLNGSNTETITLPNEARLVIGQNSATRTLNWQVMKGDFRMSVEGIWGWEAVGLTGLSAAMAWNVDTKTVALAIDIKNTSFPEPANMLLIGLPANVTARIAPGATFQYAGEAGSNDFQTSSLGGSVVLVNSLTGQEVDLEAGSMPFVSGRPMMRGGPFRGTEPVELSFNLDAGVDLGAALGNLSLPVGGSKVIRGRNGSVLQASNEQGIGLVLESLSGEFTFTTVGMRSGAITLPEGGTVAIAFDPVGGVLTAITRRGRASVLSGDGTTQDIAQDTMVTVISGRLTTSSARPEDDVMYFENLRTGLRAGRGREGAASGTEKDASTANALAAGGGGGTGGGGPTRGFRSRTAVSSGVDQLDLSRASQSLGDNELDLPRISQPPASVVGR